MTEGEDLLEAGLAAGAEPELAARRRGAGWRGGRAGAARHGVERAGLGDAGRSACSASAGPSPGGAGAACYLHGVGDPGNVGTIVRTAHALVDGHGGAGPGVRGPVLAEGRAGEHGLDLRAAARAGRGIERDSTASSSAWTPTAARRSAGGRARAAGRPLPRRRARGPRRARSRTECDARITIPLATAPRVAQRRRGGRRSRCSDIVDRRPAVPDVRADRRASRRGRGRDRLGRRPDASRSCACAISGARRS